MTRLTAFALLTITLIIALSLWFIRAQEPPAPLPANAPATAFSAQRAFGYVQQIARQPHAMGTPAHAQVRTYLLGQLRLLGLEPQVQETIVAHRSGPKAGYVFNLLARLPGQQPTGRKAVLMLAHYDSQPNALGAADDGSCVAAILETARALKAGPPLQHDVIFLLTDGEEYGLFGAQAFVNQHPWAKDVAFVMNLEARGVRGPAMTFEISPQNGWAVDALIKAAPYPVASSLMYEIYSSLPNNTDFTVFRQAGYTGINSAYIDGFVHYHKLTDSPQNLSLSSMQHHGSNLLAMTRHVANQPLVQTKAPDRVFFNTVGFHMVQYPLGLHGWLVGLLALVLLGTLVTGVRRGVVSVGRSLAGAGLFLLAVVLIMALFWPLTVGIRGLLPTAFFYDYNQKGEPLPFRYYLNGLYGSDRFLVGYVLLTVGLFGLLMRVALRWVRSFSLVMGVYLVLFGLVLLALLKVPSGTYLLLFPLLFSALGTWVVLHWRLNEQLDNQRQLGIAFLTALPALTLIPLVRMLFVTFDLQMPIIAAMLLFLLVLGLLLPLLLVIDQPLRWYRLPRLPLVPLLSLGLGLLVTGWAIRAERPSPTQPQHSHLSYYLDADTGRARWASTATSIDPWKAQFFPALTIGPFTDFYPTTQPRWLQTTAPALPLAAPTATILTDSSTATTRTLRLQLQSHRQAAAFEIRVVSPDSGAVRSAALNGEPVRPSRSQTVLGPAGRYVFFTGCNGLPLSRTLTLTLETRPGVPLQLLLYDETMTLPPALDKPLPPGVVYEQGHGSNQTIVRKAITL
jgi:hypothetical protein